MVEPAIETPRMIMVHGYDHGVYIDREIEDGHFVRKWIMVLNGTGDVFRIAIVKSAVRNGLQQSPEILACSGAIIGRDEAANRFDSLCHAFDVAPTK